MSTNKRKLLVVNVHGLINTPRAVRATLVQLGIGKRFSATVVDDGPVSRGAVVACKDYVTWGPVEAEFLASLLQARGRVSKSRALDEKGLGEIGFKTHAELAAKIMSDDVDRLSAVTGLKPFFSLSPPRGGFKRPLRRQFREGGVLGENPQLPDLVRRMMV